MVIETDQQIPGEVEKDLMNARHVLRVTLLQG